MASRVRRLLSVGFSRIFDFMDTLFDDVERGKTDESGVMRGARVGGAVEFDSPPNGALQVSSCVLGNDGLKESPRERRASCAGGEIRV